MSQTFAYIKTDASSEGPLFQAVRSRQTYPAMVGLHGPRLATYATQINPFDIVPLLGHDPRSDRRRLLNDQKIVELYEYMQRKTSGNRRDAIRNYIEDRMFPESILVGGFPAICIAVEYPIEYVDIAGAPGVVNMSIDTGVHNKRVALDGLGRISGALALVDTMLGADISDDDKAYLKQALSEISLPCVFYSPRKGQAPLSQVEIGQLFHDFNFKVTPVSAKDAIALDNSDPYIRATYFLAANVENIKKFGMDTKAASLGSKSKAVVVQPVLLRFVRAALEGARYVEGARNVAVADAHLTSKDASTVLGALSEFLDVFADAMGPTWTQRDSVHLSSAGWQAIGLIYYDIAFVLQNIDRAEFARALASKVDWNRNASIWSELVTEKSAKDGSATLAFLGAGASTRRAIATILRCEMGISDMVPALSEAA
ncbi:hypothetical protein KZX46_16700 [Polymorphobacter sp. PAMC 29334]|uniref:DNA sulfur modification protein DndB n=1 Tax=Polymorphobacter sp. PAMC 29334 TaxID=2862331 RepID=UPI001C74BEA5|nr:DNA sulfur modification protein DndB [Polymorphobacter sp. PAMC 29334]QYE34400.1 hypothetical protein KZX46_16700 [Polymorphobacter sp. PAMC 29334]